MLINITGVDGCGKGTQIALLKKYYLQKGCRVEITKAYDEMEKELFSAYIEYASQIEIMFIFQAFHTKQKIATEKALSDGKIVLADRWDETYFAYHRTHGLLSVDKELRDRLNKIAYGDMKPDVSFLLEAEPTVAMQRCVARGADFFDRKGIDYHSELGLMYEKITHEDPNHWRVIEGKRSILEVHKSILKHLENFVIL